MDSSLSAKESSPVTGHKLTGSQRLLEAGLIFTSIFSLYLIVALFSFDASDPGWSQTAYHATVNNKAGALGAYLSDILLFTFGLVAYALPFGLAFTGWLLFQRVHLLLDIDFFTLALKLVGAVLMVVGFTAIFSMNVDDLYGFSSGGLIGNYVSYSLMPYLNYTGSSLLYIIMASTGFVLTSGVSLFRIIDSIGEQAINAYLLVKSMFSKATSHYKDVGTDIAQNDVDSVADDSKKTSKRAKAIKQPVLSSVDVDDVDVAIHDDVGDEMHREDATDGIVAKSKSDKEADLVSSLFGMFSGKKHSDASDANSQSDDQADDEFNHGLASIDDDIDEPVFGDFNDSDLNPELNPQLNPDLNPELSDDNVIDFDAPSQSVPLSSAAAKPAKDKLPSELLAEKYESMPTIELLDRADKAKNPISQEELDQVSRLVEARLLDYGVEVQVTDVFPGPVITRFELDLAPGVKVSKISNLSKDLARALSAASVRVVEVIPGKSVIGLEIPNKHREMVRLSEIISCEEFNKAKSSLAMVIGKDIAGDPVVADLGKMPHILVAGTTGSGKSVVVNVMIVSMLYKSTPEDVRFIMIDPKMLELSIYEGIPHLLSEVVTDMKDAANALRWCVGEMERRYKLMSAVGVRNLKGYNQKVCKAIEEGEPLIDPLWQPTDGLDQTPPLLEKLPSIVVVVDEFADMMMIVGKKVEELIARIAQKARAAGIHLILATQRPSVDVITGLIKANIPTRMALTVQSRIDSRTILDQQGAEQLLGHGDMLYLPQGTSIPLRAQGAFIDDHEVHAVVADWKSRGEPNYVEDILSGETTEDNMLPGEASDSEETESDPLFDEVVAFVTESRRVSISSVQRKFRIGYNRSARIVEDMEMAGIVSSPAHNGQREVLAPPPVKV
ncbi:DNA translocase FtsK [Thalassotalea sp. HSM 43]|uniref:DNA translocase FtsK n=1 Tax=Thalassotalea sp. HSM 43 TaxID=2552945 RepID=UPI00107FF8E3|nr:DNA translocase FtsK [Thalassotalea sp. HSM 43]QBY05964.1 DNA translocase FtsK [Thalassotalea sp. HSM 43]